MSFRQLWGSLSNWHNRLDFRNGSKAPRPISPRRRARWGDDGNVPGDIAGTKACYHLFRHDAHDLAGNHEDGFDCPVADMLCD
jgi:hypothetical protein